MTTRKSFLVFSVGDRRFALDVTNVERVVFAAELVPLADAPAHIRGLINIAGEIMPVIDLRQRLGFSSRDMNLSDRFVVTRTAGCPTALLVEAVEGVVELPVQQMVEGEGSDMWTAAAALGADGRLVEICNTEALVKPHDCS